MERIEVKTKAAAEAAIRAGAVLYSEAAFFDNAAFQHIADREERQRLERKGEIARKIVEADAEIARFPRISNPLPRSEVPQFVRSLDALLSRPKLARQLKEI